MNPSVRKETVGYDPGPTRKEGIEITLKLSPRVFRALKSVKELTGETSTRRLFHKAMLQHVVLLRMHHQGSRIVAMRGEEPAPLDDLRPIASDNVDGWHIDEADVVTGFRVGFSPAEAKPLAEIQRLLGLGQMDTHTPIAQALLSYFWQVEMRRNGYSHIVALAEVPAEGVELCFDPVSGLITSG